MALIFTTIISIQHLKIAKKNEWNDASFCGKMKLCARDIWGRKSVYLPLVSHLADTVTDFASVVEFGIVAATYDQKQCGVNVWYLFALSIGSMVLYRSISAYKMYHITKSWKRTVMQALDIELYHVLFFSHKWGLSGSSSPQRLISILESVFEAAPQSVIQLVYLLATKNKSPMVITSTVLSFINLTLSICGDDAKMLSVQFGDIKWMLLYIFRILDVPSKLLFYVFGWVFVSGYLAFGMVLLDTLIGIGIYMITNYTDALLAVVATPLTFGSEEYEVYVASYGCYSLCELVAINCVIWIWINVSDAWSDRDLFEDYEPFVVGLWFYCSISSVLKWCVACTLFYIDNDILRASKERSDLNALVNNGSYADAMELILFKDTDLSSAASKLYGDMKYTLLAVVLMSKNEQCFNTILQHGLDIKVTDEKRSRTALIVALEESKHHAIQSILSSPQIDIDYLMVADTDGVR
eukprot:855939_1